MEWLVTNRSILISTGFLFLVLVLSSFTGVVFHGGPESVVVRNNGNQMVLADSYTPHAPITITSNADFINQGWPGSGISGDPYVIEGLNITADAICISIRDTTVYFEVRDCIIPSGSSADFVGILLSNVIHGTVCNCIVDRHSNGIHLFDSSSCTLMDNTVINNYFGFYLPQSDNCTLTNNTATNNYLGFDLSYVDSCTLTNNTASSNTEGFYILSSSNCTLINNTASGNSHDGFYIQSSGNCTLTSNTVSNNVDGFHLFDSSSCTLTSNTASSNDYGIYLRYSIGCTLTSNTASTNSYHGFYLRYSIGCTLTSNTASTNSYHGFYLSYSENCNLTSNTASNNSRYGVYLWTGSMYNMLYLNRLGNNSMSNARDDGGSNFWDDGVSLGNYWNDYSGTGTYLIPGDAGSTDNYPFAQNTMDITSETSLLISYYLTFGGIFAVLLIAIAYSGNRRRSKSSIPEIQTSDIDSYKPVSQEIPPVQQSSEITMEDESPLKNRVEVLRGCEMVGGDFEYKVKVKNDTRYVIDNVVVSLVAYPDDCMVVDGPTSKKISRIEPGGFRSPLFKFTPTKDCVEGKIMASVSYMNHENKLHMKEVKEFTIKSVCDLLQPLESTLDQFNSFLDGMCKTSSTQELDWNPQVLYEKARILLPSRNFFIVESTVEKIGDSFNGIIRGLALGKYTDKKVAIRVLISGSIEGNTAKVVLEGLGEDEAMLPTALSELTTGINAWICLNCGASLGVSEVSLIRSKNAIECGYCKRTLTHELYIK